MVKRGRKCKYESYVEPYFAEIEKWAETMTEAQIAEKLGVSYRSWNEYKCKFPQLCEVLKKGRQKVVKELRSALIQKACGFSKMVKKPVKCKTVEYENGKRLRESEEVSYYEEETYFPPDTAALNLALKNYDKNNWANDPQMLEIRKKEIELREKQIEQNSW